MSELKDEGIPLVGCGILMPQVNYRWRLKFTKSMPLIDEIQYLLKQQVTSFSFNYHKQLLEMVLEQNLNNTHIHTLIKQLSKLSKTNKYDDVCFVVEQLDGNETVTGRFLFNSCRLLDHTCDLDYASRGTCKHWLQFSYKETKDLT